MTKVGPRLQLGVQSTGVSNVIDTLPPRIRTRLRANRIGHTLPDNHGQIWMELATLAEQDETLFRGTTNAEVEMEMLETLGLSGRVKFPIRRLVTLWKNNSWRAMITRWCRTGVGRSTFNISLWGDLARFRIDDVSLVASLLGYTYDVTVMVRSV